MSSPEPDPDVDPVHDDQTEPPAPADAATDAAGAAIDEADEASDEAGEASGPADDAAEPADAEVAQLPPRLADLPTLTLPEQVEPVRRRRGRRKGSDAGGDPTSDTGAPMPSLASPLLSGRSLEPTRKRRRFELLRDHPRWLIAAAVVLLVVVGLVVGKMFAENAADAAMSERAAELEEMLADATPEEFLAFSSGVQESGSLAERTRDLDGFVNVKATAAQSFIRFQPSGWWSGFTERCLVAVVREDGVSVTVPKTACIRVEEPAA